MAWYLVKFGSTLPLPYDIWHLKFLSSNCHITQLLFLYSFPRRLLYMLPAYEKLMLQNLLGPLLTLQTKTLEPNIVPIT